jgi:hypothetical protein
MSMLINTSLIPFRQLLHNLLGLLFLGLQLLNPPLRLLEPLLQVDLLLPCPLILPFDLDELHGGLQRLSLFVG